MKQVGTITHNYNILTFSISELKDAIIKFNLKYSFLSNFYYHKFVYKGIGYITLEHAYQSMKFVNEEDKILVINQSTPGSCKRTANALWNDDKIEKVSNWHDIKYDIMFDLVMKKFEDPKLKLMLLETEDRFLIEGNNHGDQNFGMTFDYLKTTLTGRNNLGFILMEVRKFYKNN